MTVIRTRFIVRRDTAAAWTTVNPVLLAGELALETGGGMPALKIGDGATAWNSLAYWTDGGVKSFNTRTGVVTLSYSDVTGALGFTPTSISGAIAGVAFIGNGLIKSNGSALGVVAAPAGTIVGTTDTQTLSNKRYVLRSSTAATQTTLAPDLSASECYEITALASALAIATPTGSPANFDQLHLRITDNSTAQALSWSTDYVGSISSLPTTTVAGKLMRLTFEFASSTAKWQLIGLVQQP